MLLIRNGAVHLGAGRCQTGWDILCDGPVIRALGPGLEAADARVIDAAGLDVYPGLVLGLCAVGAVGFGDFSGAWDINETSTPLSPEADIRHAFDLRELKSQRFGRAGITSYGLSPGIKNLLAGQMAFIHVDGERTEDVFLAKQIALKGNYTKTVKNTFGAKMAPQTRMAMFQMLDDSFRAAQEYMEKAEKDYDAGKEVLCRALRRETPFVVNANTQNEIESVILLGRRYNLDVVLCGAYGLAPVADQVIELGWHVFLGDANNMSVGLDTDMCHERFVEMYRKGLKLSIFASGDEGYANAYEQLHWVAALMHRGGATGGEIMDMMTINPAKALRVDHLVGSLEVGKQADIILCRGNPVERFDNYIEHTIVAGKHFFSRGGQ